MHYIYNFISLYIYISIAYLSFHFLHIYLSLSLQAHFNTISCEKLCRGFPLPSKPDMIEGFRPPSLAVASSSLAGTGDE